jgi:hypothetical protein
MVLIGHNPFKPTKQINLFPYHNHFHYSPKINPTTIKMGLAAHSKRVNQSINPPSANPQTKIRVILEKEHHHHYKTF